MAPNRLTDEALFAVARTLGADVPFLTSTAPTAIGFVRGDVIVACPPPHKRDLIMLVPPFSVSSADAFGWYAEAHESDERKRSRMGTPASGIALATVEAALARQAGGPAVPSSIDHAFSWREIATLAGNDLQDVVVARHPELSRAIALLMAAGAPLVQMTGSGSTVFGVFNRRPSGGVIAMPQGFTALHAQTLTSVAEVQLS